MQTTEQTLTKSNATTASVIANGPGGTIISTDPSQFNAAVIGTGTKIFACFAAGTHILTPRGDIAIENLREGDLVITTEGANALRNKLLLRALSALSPSSRA